MTSTDIWILIASIILIIYSIWLWNEIKDAVPFQDNAESQNEGAQTHEMTSDEEIPSNETKTQQEARK
jgi:hypothetical protein